MKIFGKSIQGRRNYNQDRIFYQIKNKCFILAVADGMGGSRGGEIASTTVIEQCEKSFQHFCKKPSEKKLRITIKNIYAESHKIIKNLIKENSKLENMGTTLTIVLGYNQKYIVGNIGDSRTYILTKDKMNQITIDNSYLQEYQDNYPDAKIDEYLESKLGHIITKSISGKYEKIDIYPIKEELYELQNNDLFLLCSDGLLIYKFDDLSKQFMDIILNSGVIENAVEELINWAYSNESYDNISVIIGSNKENII